MPRANIREKALNSHQEAIAKIKTWPRNFEKPVAPRRRKCKAANN